MTRLTKTIAAATGACILAAMAGGAAAQGAPSLDVTLGFIRDKAAEQGLLAYASTTRDTANNQTWNNQFTAEASNVVSNAGDCSLSFHWHTAVDGKVAQDMDTTIQFRIATSAAVTSMDEDVARINARDGHSGWISQMRPSIWVLLIHYNDGHTRTLDFHDQDMAERVAKAVRRAAELCGGATSTPF